MSNEVEKHNPQLYKDLCQLIDDVRIRIATTVNAEACWLNWNIGKRIKEDVLYNERAEYGKEILKNLSIRLTERYGSGWGIYKLQHCVRAAYTFTQDEIEYALRTQLTWTHLRSLMAIEDKLKRKFYMEMTRIEHWSTRTLDKKIDGMLYERTALSRKPEELVEQELKQMKETGSLTPDVVFRSSYFLDMLGLADTYSEKDLEDAILLNLQSFIKEIGNDFAFLDRQKRITIDAVDYRIDLLFFHRTLRRLVAIDLKLG